MAKKSKKKESKPVAQSAAALRAGGLKAFQSGDTTQAITTWERIPADLRPVEALAEAYFRRGLQRLYGSQPDPQAGLQDLQQANQYLPDDPLYAYHLGLAWHRQGNPEAAIPLYRQARQPKSPTLKRAAYPLALALLQAGQDPETDSAWTDLNPNQQAMLRNAGAFRRRPYTPAPQAPQLWHALASLDRGERPAAQAGLIAVLQSPAAAAEKRLVHFYLGVLAMQAGDEQTAREEWTTAYAAGLRSERLERNLAELYQRLAEKKLIDGDHPTALAAAQEAARHAPQDNSLKELLAQIHQHLGYQAASANRWDQAQQHWQTAVELDSSSFRLAYNLALAYERDQKFESAGAAWREALRRRPRRADHPDALSDDQVARLWQRAADVYRVAGDTEEAASVYRQALKWAPQNIDIRMALANSLIAEERLNAAQNELTRVLEIKKDHIPALLRMAEVLYRDSSGWYQSQATGYWERVLELQPGNLEARQGLADHYREQGEMYFNLGRFPFAIHQYQKALEYIPEDGWTLAVIADCYMHINDRPNAQQYMDRAMQADPKSLDVFGVIISSWIHHDEPELAWEMLERAEKNIASIPVEFYVAHADHLLDHDNLAEAERWLEHTVTRAEPGEPVLVKIGSALAESHPDLGRQYLERALEAGHYPGQAHLSLAILDHQAGQSRSSKKHLAEARKIARQTQDKELEQRVELFQIYLDGPLAFLKRIERNEDPELLDQFMDFLEQQMGMEDDFDDLDEF